MGCCGQRVEQSTRLNPVLLGDPDPEGAVLRARPTVRLGVVPAGTVGWFTGSDVAPYVARGLLVPDS